MKYQIVSDSACDLSEEADNANIKLVPFQIVFDDEHSYKENLELNVREFYQYMVENPSVFPKTTLPSVQDYVDVFSIYARENTPVICICISSKISGSYNSASVARELIFEEFPDAKIEVIDSRFATVLEGLLVLECVKMRDNLVPFEENAERLKRSISTGRIFFTVGSVDYLIAGGRMSKFAGVVTSTLGIRPVIAMREGELLSGGVTLNRKKSVEKVVQTLKDYIDTIKDEIENYSIVIGYGFDREEALKLQETLTALLLNSFGSQKSIAARQIGSTIGVHTGPYPLGIGILKNCD